MQERSQLAIRRQGENDRHHLWNNNGTWWCHYTLHLPNHQKLRRRVSLKTKELRIAQSVRDDLLRDMAQLGRLP